MKVKMTSDVSSALQEESTFDQEEKLKALSNVFISYPFVVMSPIISSDRQQGNPSSKSG